MTLLTGNQDSSTSPSELFFEAGPWVRSTRRGFRFHRVGGVHIYETHYCCMFRCGNMTFGATCLGAEEVIAEPDNVCLRCLGHDSTSAFLKLWLSAA
jgi:hypothetical protein